MNIYILEIHKHELQIIMERIKDANWSFTKDLCLQIGKLKKPIPEVIDLAEKFMSVLDQKEKSWKMFQVSYLTIGFPC